MFKVCGTKCERYCTDLDAYISKKQKVPVNAKCYSKEIMSLGGLLFIYLDLHYIIIFLHSLVDLITASLTTFRLSDKSLWAS